MAQIRVDLGGALAGKHVIVDDDALTMGALEDMQSQRVGDVLAAVASFIVGGDLPQGTDKAGLRKLRPSEFRALAEGTQTVLSVPKAT